MKFNVYVFRIGNTTPAMLEEAVRLIGETLNEVGCIVDIEQATACLQEKLAIVAK
ncbi:hypothetical protein [Lysinibacillus sp. RS5]|uniref:hypothetical protein n=1 Tax=unclassified Lysinibacillus TaxID=2636778 RepID=UPI0035BE8CED